MKRSLPFISFILLIFIASIHQGHAGENKSFLSVSDIKPLIDNNENSSGCKANLGVLYDAINHFRESNTTSSCSDLAWDLIEDSDEMRWSKSQRKKYHNCLSRVGNGDLEKGRTEVEQKYNHQLFLEAFAASLKRNDDIKKIESQLIDADKDMTDDKNSCDVMTAMINNHYQKFVRKQFSKMQKNSEDLEFEETEAQYLTRYFKGKISGFMLVKGNTIEFISYEAADSDNVEVLHTSVYTDNSTALEKLMWSSRKGVKIFTEPNQTINAGVERIKQFQLSPDEKHVAILGIDHVKNHPPKTTLKLWDIETGKVTQTFGEILDDFSEIIAFSPDGKHIATVERLNTIQLWSVSTGKKIKIFSEPSCLANNEFGRFCELGFTPDGNKLVGRIDEIIMQWDVTTGIETHTINIPHPVLVSDISSDGRYMITAGFGKNITLVDLTENKIVKDIKGSSNFGKAICLYFGVNAKYIFTVYSTGKIVRTDIASEDKESFDPGLYDRSRDAIYRQIDNTLVIAPNLQKQNASDDNEVLSVYDVGHERELAKIDYRVQGYDGTIAVTEDGKLALTSDAGKLHIWRLY